MEKMFRHIILGFIMCLTSACTAQVESKSGGSNREGASYAALLGKSVADPVVADFISRNNCSSLDRNILCGMAGMMLWLNPDQKVNSIFLYAAGVDGFNKYRGQLPLGLTFYDPMWKVEEKLGHLNADEISQSGLMGGLPDEGSSPDHFHYWAVYKRFGMTVIYNSPFADEDAYIYAILVNV